MACFEVFSFKIHLVIAEEPGRELESLVRLELGLLGLGGKCVNLSFNN